MTGIFDHICLPANHAAQLSSGGVTRAPLRNTVSWLKVHPAFIGPASAAILTALGLFWTSPVLSADDKAFRPITTNVLGYSTSRGLVDIEIVGSTSLVPQEHKLEPERILRLRIERAYVTNFLTKADPGFSLLSIAVDRPSGLPEAFISAVSMQGRFHEDIAGVPTLNPDEASRRHITLTIRSFGKKPTFIHENGSKLRG